MVAILKPIEKVTQLIQMMKMREVTVIQTLLVLMKAMTMKQTAGNVESLVICVKSPRACLQQLGMLTKIGGYSKKFAANAQRIQMVPPCVIPNQFLCF